MPARSACGRATHGVLECLVQEPSKDVLPIRDLIPRRVCLRVTSERHPDMVDGMQRVLRWAHFRQRVRSTIGSRDC